MALDLKVDGGKFDLARYPFLIDLFEDESKHITVRKGSQMGFTVCFVLRTIDMALYRYQRGVLYLMPTREDVADFSKSRFSRMMKDNHESLGQVLGDTDSIGIKRVGESFIYFRGSRSRSQLKSIPVDAIVYDEKDEMEQGMVELASHRIDGSTFGDIAELSTPTIPDFGVDLSYQQSDQKTWRIKCRACGAWTCLEETFPDCLLRRADGTVFRACKKCQREVRIEDGQWVAGERQVEDHSGYFVSQLCSPTVSPRTILDEFENPEPGFDMGEFYNHRLGLAYAAIDDVLDEQLLLACVGDYARYHSARGPCVLGADVGKNDIHYMIGQKISDRQIELLDFGVLPDFGPLADRLQRFNVVKGCLDGMAETRKVNEFCAAHPECWAVWYSEAQRKAYDWVENENRVNVNRTELLDHSHQLVIQRRCVLPRKDDRWPEFVRQMCNLARIQQRDDETGLPTTRWVIRGGRKRDHFRHAFAYLALAAENSPVAASIRRILTPAEARRSPGTTWMSG